MRKLKQSLVFGLAALMLLASPSLAAFVPLQPGGATEAKQPALGTAGTPSTDVLTVQGAPGSSPLYSYITNGTNIADILGIGTGYNAAVTGTGRVEVTASTTGTGAQTILVQDCSNLHWVCIQVTSYQSGGAVSFQGSNVSSSGPWVTVSLNSASTVGNNVPSTLVTGNNTIWTGSVPFKYFQVVTSAFTSGTTTLVCEFYTNAIATTNNGYAAAQNGTWTVQQGTTPSATPWLFQAGAVTGVTNTLLVAKVISTAGTNATLVKGTSGNLAGYQFYNSSATAKFVKFFNKSTAPTPGTDTPVFTVPIPAGQSVSLESTLMIGFVTGEGYCITGAYADNDTTTVAAGDVVGSIFYK